MSLLARRALLFLVVLSLFGGAVAHADSLVSLMGWPYDIALTPGLNYSTNNPIGEETILNRITNLVYPVLGLPAIVAKGDTLNVIVKHANPIIYLDPSEWHVQLTTKLENPYDAYADVGDAVAQNYSLTVLAVEYEMQSKTYHLQCEVPWGAPEDLYHLLVETDDIIDFQPACVKVLEEITDNFTFVHITDSQVADYNGLPLDNQLNNYNYPGFGEDKLPSQAIFENEILRELALLKPDFAVFTGDLIYGLDIPAEYEYFLHITQQTQVPLFMAPGNHDGYSFYLWQPTLQNDGLEHYSRILGPQYYSFDVGNLHFVMINSYDGTPLRREASPLPPEIPVENWGGFISEEQLNWIARDLAEAQKKNQNSLLFLHHDPRGPFTANKRFPTNPFAGDGSEVWNYESEVYDSNPYDGIEFETPQHNTGTRLVNLAASNRISHFFIGHNHSDRLWQFMPGDVITDRYDEPVGDGITASRGLSFVQTTTCSAGVDRAYNYNGYRLIRVANARPTKINYLENPVLAQSIPAGNFWFEDFNNDGTFTDARIAVTNGLPTRLTVNLEFYLAGLGSGYQIVNETSGGTLPIVDVGLGANGQVVIYAGGGANGVDAPINQFPFEPGQEAVTIFAARPHPNNLSPYAGLIVTPTETEGVWQFDATDSYDPEDGDLKYFWDFGDGATGTNQITTHKYVTGGDTTVTLTVLDPHGGKASAQTVLNLPDCCPDRDHDSDEDLCTGCGVGNVSTQWPNALPFVALISLLLAMKFAPRKRRLG